MILTNITFLVSYYFNNRFNNRTRYRIAFTVLNIFFFLFSFHIPFARASENSLVSPSTSSKQCSFSFLFPGQKCEASCCRLKWLVQRNKVSRSLNRTPTLLACQHFPEWHATRRDATRPLLTASPSHSPTHSLSLSSRSDWKEPNARRTCLVPCR